MFRYCQLCIYLSYTIPSPFARGLGPAMSSRKAIGKRVFRIWLLASTATPTGISKRSRPLASCLSGCFSKPPDVVIGNGAAVATFRPAVGLSHRE